MENISDNRSRILVIRDGIIRFMMLNSLTKTLPLYVVTEYPKSGGTWLSQMISNYLGIPLPRSTYPKLVSSVITEHLLYSPLMHNVICMHRDGRDIIVSLYYYSLFQNELNSPYLVKRTRKDLPFNDYDDIKRNLSKFIQYIYDRDAKSMSPFRFTWPDFENNWEGKGTVHVKYEDLILNGFPTLASVIKKVTNRPIDENKLRNIYKKFSFKNQSKRNPGVEKKTSFLRKGKPGDWLYKFDKRSGNLFNELAGKALIRRGYETDDSWVNKLK